MTFFRKKYKKSWYKMVIGEKVGMEKIFFYGGKKW